jgi:hypothetical protein
MNSHFHPPRRPRQRDILRLSEGHIRYLACLAVKRSEERVLNEQMAAPQPQNERVRISLHHPMATWLSVDASAQYPPWLHTQPGRCEPARDDNPKVGVPLRVTSLADDPEGAADAPSRPALPIALPRR